ncbi:MAG: hypothetical protein PHS49_02295 [Candidatus Gracilibacteria bacterium]|nr:hypothetical protein [Candidatus Gracilibacteria bacterium]
MSNLKYWEDKIKEKRKNTDFRKFIKEIASWSSLSFYKIDGNITRCPKSNRLKEVVIASKFDENEKPMKEYNFSLDFFTNYGNLFSENPFSAVIDLGGNENTNYSDCTFNSKNVYLSNTTIGAQNVFYSLSTKMNSTNVFDSVVVWSNCENIYSSTGIINSYNIFYSSFINDSNNIWFSSNLTGCSECFGCNNLINKSYCINNLEYSKEEYLKFKKDLLEKKDKYIDWYDTTSNISGNNIGAVDSKGEYIINSQNVINGKYCFNINNGNNVLITGGDKDENMFDSILTGSGVCSDFYGVINSGPSCQNLYICAHITLSSNLYYSYNCNNCSYCIGCVGLKNKSYCILNKQYTKEEYNDLADKIFSQMEVDGTLGEFFPGELNPFYFNDTMAYLLDDSFTKQEVEKQGYMWRDAEIKVDIPEGVEVIFPHPQPLPSKEGRSPKSIQDYQGYDSNGNWQINPEILKKVIQDEKGNIYRIVQMEYDFLVKHGLPLPENHWLDRIKMGFKFK